MLSSTIVTQQSSNWFNSVRCLLCFQDQATQFTSIWNFSKFFRPLVCLELDTDSNWVRDDVVLHYNSPGVMTEAKYDKVTSPRDLPGPAWLLVLFQHQPPSVSGYPTIKTVTAVVPHYNSLISFSVPVTTLIFGLSVFHLVSWLSINIKSRFNIYNNW